MTYSQHYDFKISIFHWVWSG